MPMLNVFQNDAFNTLSLTAAINKAPFAPSFLGSMGIFRERGIPTDFAMVEEKHNTLALVQTSSRGTRERTENRADRISRVFKIPFLTQSERVLATDVQNVRSFGSETELETVARIVQERLDNMRMNLEVTHEWHRVGAIQGVTYDADTSTVLYDWFSEFGGLTQSDVDFVLGTSTTNIKGKCTDVIRLIENALGLTPFMGVVGVCGNDFWDAFVDHDDVKNAFDRWQEGAFLRTSQRAGAGGFAGPGGQTGFDFAGITFYNYRGNLGGTDFIPTGDCRFVPVGVANLFETIYAPADYVETANTIGQAFYAKQQRMDFDLGIELDSVSAPLIMPTRPQCLVRGHTSN